MFPCISLKNEVIRYVSTLLGVQEELVSNELTAMTYAKDIYIENEYVFLRSYFEAEDTIARRIIMMCNDKVKEYKSLNEKIENVERIIRIDLSEEQKQAIKLVFKNKVSIITGGPGTGKTTIIKGLLNMYQLINKLSNKALENEVALLAPTGRAAKRISETCKLSASTIHRFLKWDKENNIFAINELNKVH